MSGQRIPLEEYWGTFDDYKILELDEKAKKNPNILMKVGGMFQAEDAKNKNGRIYPSETWDAVFGDDEWREQLENRGVLGEVDHPKDGGALRRTSHVITHLERKNVNGKKLVYGEAEILNTPDGQVAATLFGANCRVGISSRGEGSVEHDNKAEADMVKTDFRPEAFDFVTKPSTIVDGLGGAYPKPLTESEIKQNNETVVTALTELVEQTSDKKVLLSCFRTLEGGYKASEQGKKLLEKLEEKLTEETKTDPEPSAVPSVENKDPKPSQEPKEEDPMESKITKEAMDELHQMARDLAAKEIADNLSKHQEEKGKLQQQITDITARLEDTQKKLDAAERIIEEFQSKIKEMEENAPKATEEDTQKRLEAAKKLIDTMLKQMEELKDAKEYGDAAEKVAQALIDKGETDKVERYVAGSLAGIKNEEKRESVKKLVSGAKTIEEAKERLSALGTLVPFKPKGTKEPLPTDVDPSTLTEEQKKALEEQNKNKGKKRGFAGKLMQRVGRR